MKLENEMGRQQDLGGRMLGTASSTAITEDK